MGEKKKGKKAKKRQVSNRPPPLCAQTCCPTPSQEVRTTGRGREEAREKKKKEKKKRAGEGGWPNELDGLDWIRLGQGGEREVGIPGHARWDYLKISLTGKAGLTWERK